MPSRPWLLKRLYQCTASRNSPCALEAPLDRPSPTPTQHRRPRLVHDDAVRRPTDGSASPPTRPIDACRHALARRASASSVLRVRRRRRHHDPRGRLAEERLRRRRSRPRLPRRPARRPPRRGRRRSSTRRASPPGRPRRSRAPTRSDPPAPPSTSTRCSAASRARSSAGGTPRTRPCIDLQVLAAAELAAALAEQDDHVAVGAERPPHDACRRPRSARRRRAPASAARARPSVSL